MLRLLCHRWKTSPYKLDRSRSGPMAKKNPCLYWGPNLVVQLEVSQFTDRTIPTRVTINLKFLLCSSLPKSSMVGVWAKEYVIKIPFQHEYLSNVRALLISRINQKEFNSQNLGEVNPNFGIMKLVTEFTYLGFLFISRWWKPFPRNLIWKKILGAGNRFPYCDNLIVIKQYSYWHKRRSCSNTNS